MLEEDLVGGGGGGWGWRGGCQATGVSTYSPSGMTLDPLQARFPGLLSLGSRPRKSHILFRGHDLGSPLMVFDRLMD